MFDLFDVRQVSSSLQGIRKYNLLLDDIRAIFHGDCSPAVLEAFDAVGVRSNPVRHVGGIEDAKC
jgi:hypothetical protein